MRRATWWTAMALASSLGMTGCGGTQHGGERAVRAATMDASRRAARVEAARTAVGALQSGDLRAAETEADHVIASDGDNALARAVRAIARYQRAGHTLAVDLLTIVGGAGRNGPDTHLGRIALAEAETAFAAVDADLRVVETDADFALELCPACWHIDWNRNGRVDESDEKLFQIEEDAQGAPIPDDDPRRRPTWRLDVGDASWARAMVAFQRALVDLVLAYSWEALWGSFAGDGPPTEIRVPLADKVRFEAARARLREALAEADRCRRAYLAETDDDREWVPSPRQKSHPLPLPVDDALYRTWADVVADVTRILDGKEGLSIAELAQLGDRHWAEPPRGYLDLGALLRAPKDIVIHPMLLESAVLSAEHQRGSASVESALADTLGAGYRKEMPASPLLGRLARMKGELDRGEESLARKLKYFLWLN